MSAAVQLIVWKDLSLKWPVMCGVGCEKLHTQSQMLRKQLYLKEMVINKWQIDEHTLVKHTPQSFHVRNGHAENCQLVRLACQCTTCWHHVTQFVHVRWHFVTPSSFNLTMALPNHSQQQHLNNRRLKTALNTTLSNPIYVCIIDQQCMYSVSTKKTAP